MTLAEVKALHPTWFSKGNKRYFNDIGYRVLHGKRTKTPYLVQETYGFTDMFGEARKHSFFQLHEIKDGLVLSARQTDYELKTIDDVKRLLRDL